MYVNLVMICIINSTLAGTPTGGTYLGQSLIHQTQSKRILICVGGEKAGIVPNNQYSRNRLEPPKSCGSMNETEAKKSENDTKQKGQNEMNNVQQRIHSRPATLLQGDKSKGFSGKSS